jgi:hypothetical protein
MNYHKNKDIILPLSLFILTILTRIPFMSKLLYHWDSVQFALALENYDITVHQPHPPGYFLYVMLGRLINFFIKDANTTFIFISILFSGLAVVAIYYLGKEIFDKKTGIVAALIALTSPNLWFHGEVALTYIVEAFFSSFVALLCWRILKGEHKYILLSVVALSIAGGIRQNTVVFLLPLWLFSVKGVLPRKIIASIGLLGIVCLLWFVPMVWLTGGWHAYNEALRELWEFNTGHVSVFEQGWATFKIFSSALVRFVIYGVGAGIFILGLAMYSLIRHRKLRFFDSNKIFFFLLWFMPSVLFYLLIFIHPANPGYVLIFLPALLILTAASIGFISNDLKGFIPKDFAPLIASIIIVINTTMFFVYHYVSCKEIRTHDRDLSIMFDGIKSFNPEITAIFVEPYIFYGFRHIMYYLPEYRVYLVDVRITPTGERRKTSWGIHGETFLSNDVVIPSDVNMFIIPTLTDIGDKVSRIKGASIKKLSSGMFIASGPLVLIQEIFPELILKSHKDHGT